MIQLTNQILAVEVPNDATDIILIHSNTRLAYFHPNYVRIDLSYKAEYLIGVTPLSEEQAKIIVESLTERSLSMTLLHGYKNYDLSKKYGSSYPFMQASKSFNSLLESKGLDINKKYAIIKIEKK